MLQADFPLYIATWKVFKQVDDSGSDEWIRRKARTVYKLVLQQIVDDESWTDQGIPWSLDQVLDAWTWLRKGGEKNRTLCEVAFIRGMNCFYFARDKGPCSEDVNLDRILPASRGGEYTLANCVISCSRHNQSRGDKTIEEFLANGKDSLLLPLP